MSPDKSEAIRDLVAKLDESGSRDFIAFTLGQRRPRLHRLFVTASRRAYLARMSPIDSGFSNYAKAIKRGVADEDLYRDAADFAGMVPPWPAETPVPRDKIPLFEAGRAAYVAAEAARLTGQDIANLNAEHVGPGAALAASLHALMVISGAHSIDARASSKVGLAFATTTSLVAMEKAQDEHVKWLNQRLAQEGGSERQGPSLLGRLIRRGGRRS